MSITVVEPGAGTSGEGGAYGGPGADGEDHTPPTALPAAMPAAGEGEVRSAIAALKIVTGCSCM